MIPVSLTCREDAIPGVCFGTCLLVDNTPMFVIASTSFGDTALASVDQSLTHEPTTSIHLTPLDVSVNKKDWSFPTATIGDGVLTIVNSDDASMYALSDDCRLDDQRSLPPQIALPLVSLSFLSSSDSVPTIAKRNAIITRELIEHLEPQRLYLDTRLNKLKNDLEALQLDETSQCEALERRVSEQTEFILNESELSSRYAIATRALEDTKRILRRRLFSLGATMSLVKQSLDSISDSVRHYKQ